MTAPLTNDADGVQVTVTVPRQTSPPGSATVVGAARVAGQGRRLCRAEALHPDRAPIDAEIHQQLRGSFRETC